MTIFFVSNNCVLPSAAFHLDLAGRGDAAGAVERLDLVLLEQERDAVDVAFDVLRLVAKQHGKIDARLADLDPHLGKTAARFFVELRSVQQGLRRNAADVEAGAAEGRILFHHGGLQAELRRANGADITAGAGADDDEIVSHHVLKLKAQLRNNLMETCLTFCLSSKRIRAKIYFFTFFILPFD